LQPTNRLAGIGPTVIPSAGEESLSDFTVQQGLAIRGSSPRRRLKITCRLYGTTGLAGQIIDARRMSPHGAGFCGDLTAGGTNFQWLPAHY
jgi:hypothetical protein